MDSGPDWGPTRESLQEPCHLTFKTEKAQMMSSHLPSNTSREQNALGVGDLRVRPIAHNFLHRPLLSSPESTANFYYKTSTFQTLWKILKMQKAKTLFLH